MTTCYCTSSAQSLDDNMLLYKFSTKSWWQHVIVQVQHKVLMTTCYCTSSAHGKGILQYSWLFLPSRWRLQRKHQHNTPPTITRYTIYYWHVWTHTITIHKQDIHFLLHVV